jgi:hypothetical protein
MANRKRLSKTEPSSDGDGFGDDQEQTTIDPPRRAKRACRDYSGLSHEEHLSAYIIHMTICRFLSFISSKIRHLGIICV